MSRAAPVRTAARAKPKRAPRRPRPGREGTAAPQRTFIDVLPPGHARDSVEDLRLRLTRRLLFIARRWRNLLDEALRGSGDSYARWLVLVWTRLLEGKANHRELAERVGVELPTLVRLLNRLEKERLVRRLSLGAKGRAKCVVLTEKGEQRLEQLSAIVTQTRADFLAGVDEQRLRPALALLDELLGQYATVQVAEPGKGRPRARA